MSPAELIDAYKAGRLSTTELKERLRVLAQQATRTPLSEGQRGLWMLQKLAPDMTAYNVPVCLRLGRALDAEKLREACAFLLEQFPILTSVIQVEHGVPLLVSRPSSLPCFQVEILSPALEPAEVLDHLRQLAKAPFALEQGPLLRVYLLSKPADGGRPPEQFLLFSMHHTIVDGRSLFPMITTLLDAYLAMVAGAPPVLVPAAASYADFVAWEQEMMTSDEGQEHHAYWQRQLAGPLPILELPNTRPHGEEVRLFEGRTHTHPLSAELSQAIQAFAESLQVNPSMVFLALFKILLYRYSGQEDLIVGLPTMGRPQERFDALIGYFINMIALRSRVDGRRPFVDFIRELELTLVDGLDHATYPFPAVVRGLHLPPARGRAPVFQVCFAYQNFVQQQEREAFGHTYGQALAIEFVDEIHQEGEFELTLEVVQHHNRFVLNLKYNPERYELMTIERMLWHLTTLAEGALGDPNRPLDAYTLLTPAESAWLVRSVPPSQPSPALGRSDACIHEVFAQQARATPDAIAVTCEEHSLTYAELDARSTILAIYLQQHGVKPESRVGICVERSMEMIVGLLGILKAAGAYVPLDPAYPSDRLAYMLRDSGVRLVLTQAAQGPRIAAFSQDIRLLALDQDWPMVDQAVRDGAPQALQGGGHPHHLAYVIYTSGSTGAPKGTLVQHDHVVRLFSSTDGYFRFNHTDVWTLFHSLSFDFSVWEIWGALLYGGRLVIVPHSVSRSPREFHDLVLRQQVTVLNQIPSAFMQLLGVSRPTGSEALPLRYIIFGGEALAIPRLKPWFERFGDTRPQLINMYGITETTVHVTYYQLTQADTAQAASNIGRPLPDLTLSILDRHGNPTPVGIPGEMYVGGAGVSRGYLNRPGLTAQRFLPNPFQPGSRLYRTGDLARWFPNTEGCPGDIEYLGRIDDQVKIRGFRIELQEVERQLLGHPHISDGVVIVKEETNRTDGPAEHKQLIAYYVPTQPGAVHAVQLRQQLRATLPEYMVPAAFVELESLPRTPSGKINRQALSTREIVRTGAGTVVLPQSEIEAQLLTIWKAVLHTEQIGVDDGFFDVGGDSLLLVAVADRIRDDLGYDVRLVSLLKYVTVRELSVHLAATIGHTAALRARTPGSSVSEQALSPSLMQGAGEGTAQDPSARQPAAIEDYQDSLAIIGISCQFPGATDHFRFWQNLCSGTESVRVFSEAELKDLGIPEGLIKDPHYIPIQASIEGKELFDPGFFNISPRDAAYMDPQFRLLLLHSWSALEDAGRTPTQVSDAGVFMSASSTFERPAAPDIGRAPEASEAYVSWVLGQGGSIPTMISHKLGLTGPSFFIQANCSSSLVGLYAAWQCLKSGEATHALVGGCTILPATGIGYLHQDGLNFSSDGHIKAFDATADGMIGGEGVAVILLKRAIDAIRDGDHIYALLRGIGANNDGTSKVGFYAPSVKGQADVVRRVLESTGINPESINYVEAHGTGTKLGDLVEITALSDVYRQYTVNTQFCGIGSVKTNIGHVDTVAGLAGCIKVALSLRYGQIPPSLNYRTPHPELDLEHSPFYVVDRLTDWNKVAGSDAPHRAALSSFGIGGTNVHAILEQAPPRQASPADAAGGISLIPLSAKADDRLRDYALKLLDFLAPDGPGAMVQLTDLSYTLQVGRETMRSRVAFLVSHVEELRQKLADFADGREQITGCVMGDVKQSPEAIALFERDEDSGDLIRIWFTKGKLDKLAELWVKGLAIDWASLYAGSGLARPHRISLPTYPFGREPFWVPGGKPLVPSSQPAPTHISLLCPVWEPVVRPSPDAAPFPATTDRIAVVGGDEEAIDVIRQHYPKAGNLSIHVGDDVDHMTRALETALDGAIIDHLFWIAPRHDRNTLALECLVSDQEHGVIHLFRIIKALLQLGYGNRALGLSLISYHTLAVHHHDAADPTHAGLHGLVGCLAKEYPAWQIRFTDLDGSATPEPLTDLYRFPPDPAGDALVCRGASWFRQRLVPLHVPDGTRRSFAGSISIDFPLPPGEGQGEGSQTLATSRGPSPQPSPGGRGSKPPSYRHGGVYVVIGGAGGIGTAWSEYMIRAYGAHIIWIGRRQMDTAIAAKIEALARLGPAPRYLSVDARDPEALQRAYDAIKQQYDSIHGVVHSAIVLRDQRLANIDEAGFRAAFSAKVDVAATMVRVFHQEPLDFVLFFSALTGFFKPEGQSNYAAGCTFQDAFAHRLAQEWTGTDGRPAIKVMNWGYWGHVGVVASRAYRDRTARAGIGSIEPPEAMQALETLLAAPVHQMALWKTIGTGAEPDAFVTMYPATLPSLAETLRQRVCGDVRASVSLLSPRELDSRQEMDELLVHLLLAQLRALGFVTNRRPTTLLAAYDRWWEESLAMLARRGHLRYDAQHRAYAPVSDAAKHGEDELTETWRRWDEHRGMWLADADLKAGVILVQTTMRALGDILTGQRRATDVMFPDSTMRLVEGTNQGNTITDFFNEVLGNTVIAYIHERQARGAEALRILEIGAGTGGTSAMLLAKLRELHGHPVREYCYTDISRGFLLHGEHVYGAANPFLTCRLFNVEEPLADQEVPADAFDVVIAANVLHATSNIRRSLRNAKAALKKHGLLLLIEMSANTLFSHLTYGLLEGWWAYDDAELRLPGCPALSPQSWRTVLEAEGFQAIFSPTDHVVDLGLQVIVAESDGVVYQRRRPSRLEPAARVPEHIARDTDKPPPDRQPIQANAVVSPQDMARSAQAHDGMVEAYVRDTIIRQLSDSLKIDRAKIVADEPFADYGIDSLTGVHVVQVLNTILKTDLETISLFDYSTVNALTGHIMAQYGDALRATLSRDGTLSERPRHAMDSRSRPPHPDPLPEGEGTKHRPKEDHPMGQGRGDGRRAMGPGPDEAIAVIGMSARFAKSPSIKELWKNLAAGADLVEEVSRWDLSRYYPDSGSGEYCRHGSFLDDIDRFDPFFFNISGLEANYMDPQQRLFLEACWEALEDAGYAGGESAVQRPTMATTVGERRCGVYVGWCGVDYGFLLGDNPPPQAHWGTTGSVIPARIAYFLDLHGPAVAVDTACSSSLVAVHLACRGLLAGEMDMALAGGVSIQTTPASFLTPNKGGMLSHTGRCYTFDERADGFVLGEGVGVVVLKRLADAVAARDNIYGVIRGSALNQDGKTNGITAPSARSQERLARQVYQTFNIPPARIGMVEAHGTGTKLGDPIELEALTRAFRQDTERTQYCAIGSIKTNLGHTIAAAGVAGLIKVLLSLRHKQIPASLHFRQSNPNLRIQDSPFYVNTNLRDWEAERDADGRPYPRLAVLSSFGFSGTNAHMAIEEPPAIDRAHGDHPGYLIVLSARSADQLRRQVEQLIVHLKDGADQEWEDCGNISYTLLLGRKHFNHRLACVAGDAAALVRLLEQWLGAGQKSAAGSPQIHVSDLDGKEHRQEPSLKRYGDQCLQACETGDEPDGYLEQLSAIAELYVQGYELEYERLFAGDRYCRIALPTYPFAREHYWVPLPPSQPSPTLERMSHNLHPPGGETGETAPIGAREDFELMLFEETWQPEVLPAPSISVPSGTVMCFLSDPGRQHVIRRVFERLGGGRVRIVFVAQEHTSGHEAAPETHVVSKAARHTYETALRRLREAGHEVGAILYLWALEDPECIRDYTPVVYLLQAMVAAHLKPERLILAGECAPGYSVDRCYLESWIGFERSLGLVLPHTQVVPIYAAVAGTASSSIEDWAIRLWDELRTPQGRAVLYQDDTRHVCRILPCDLAPGADPFRAHGTYLITGGLGGLGLLFARHLAVTRPVNLILTGRSAASATQQAWINELEALGARVSVLRADVADEVAMREGLAAVLGRFGAINGVIHAAGIVGGRSLFEKDMEHFRQVLAPKVQGCLVLDELIDPKALDFICHFSSSAAILGDFGSCDYAIGNRFQMAFARYQAQRSGTARLKALAINWPLWRGIGMGAGDAEHIRMMLKSSGQRHLEAEEGLALFDRILAQDGLHPLVLAGQPSRVHRFLGLGPISHRERTGGEGLQRRVHSPHPDPLPEGEGKVAEPLEAGERGGRRPEMQGLSLYECVVWDLRELAAQLLQTPREQLHPHQNLADFGFDSLSLIDFAARLTAHYHHDALPVISHHPSCSGIPPSTSSLPSSSRSMDWALPNITGSPHLSLLTQPPRSTSLHLTRRTRPL